VPRQRKPADALAMSELRPLKYGELECKGNGLTYRSYSRATPAQIIAALSQTSQPTDPGRVSKSTKPEGHSKAWWEAQVRLYGFKCSNWTIDGMKEVLMDAVVASFKVPAELQGVEEQLNHDYKERQKQPQPETPRTATEPSSDPESSTSSTPKAEVTEAEVIPAPTVATKAARRYDPPTKPRLERMEILHRQYLSSGHPDDVIFGEWRFDCPSISKIWSSNWDERQDIVWKIHPPRNDEDCVWVVFKQVVVEGILRINWNTGEDWKGKPLKFTFRGQETGEGYAQVADSYNNGTITFTSVHECMGKFNTQIDGGKPWEITGRKVSNKLPDISAQKCKKLYGQEPEWSFGKFYWYW
jgi:hypothetical protein